MADAAPLTRFARLFSQNLDVDRADCSGRGGRFALGGDGWRVRLGLVAWGAACCARACSFWRRTGSYSVSGCSAWGVRMALPGFEEPGSWFRCLTQPEDAAPVLIIRASENVNALRASSLG